MKRLLNKVSAKLSTLRSHFGLAQGGQFSSNKGFIQHQLRGSGAGFTLIELLIVIAIIAALAIAVFVALDPAKRINDAQDARRSADADTILTAIHASIVDKKGGSAASNMPGPNVETQLGNASTGCNTTGTGCTVTATVCADLLTGSSNLSKYLKSMPIDPDSGASIAGGFENGYSVTIDSNSIVTVKSCNAENTTISVSR